MTKEPFRQRLFCNLFGAGSAISLIILIFYLRFGIPSTIINPTTRSTQRPRTSPTRTSPIRTSPIFLKGNLYDGEIKRAAAILNGTGHTFSPYAYAYGQKCQAPILPFTEVFTFLKFKLSSARDSGNLIRFKFLRLRFYIKGQHLCFGKESFCSSRKVSPILYNNLTIGVKVDLRTQTQMITIILNDRCYKATVPLKRESHKRKIIIGSLTALKRQSRKRKIIIGSQGTFTALKKLSVIFINGAVKRGLTRSMLCTPRFIRP